MTIKEILNRAKDRWQHKPIPLPAVELIPVERLHTPPTGEKMGKRVGFSEVAR